MQAISIIESERTYSHQIAQEFFAEGYAVKTFEDLISCNVHGLKNNIDLAVITSPANLDDPEYWRAMRILSGKVEPDHIIILSRNVNDTLLKRYNRLGIEHILRRQNDLSMLKRTVFRILQKNGNTGLPPALANIIGDNTKMQELFRMMQRVAQSETATVFIRGESGTGKELIARAIHELSPNANQPFVEINCAALPDHLLESELFGYEKGAFTDAKNTKKGLLELADWGTFFLDEIGDLNVRLQIKLVKALEEKTFRRVGGLKDIKVSMRIMAATNRNVEKLVAEQQFREDLYFRLNVLSLRVPPLRDRGEDFLLLAEHFRKHFNKEHHCQIDGFTKDALEMMRNYPWPGNVRELKNALERSVLMGRIGKISPDLLELGRGHIVGGFHLAQKNGEIDVKIPKEGISLEDVEQALLKKSLEISEGNKSKAARLLKLSRETFRYRLNKFNIE